MKVVVTPGGDIRHVTPAVEQLRLNRKMRRALFALFLALPMLGGEPLPIEDHNFMAEGGWNREDAVLQYNTFFFRDAMAFELTQEWAASSPRHQLGYTIPMFSDDRAGLGDAMLNYRYQLLGTADSRVALAPRVSLILPTRSARFGRRSSGVQVSLPLSASITPRLETHTNVGATWYRDRGERELNVGQSIALAVTDRVALSVDASYTRCTRGEPLLVIRPGVQFSIEGPAGLGIAPGVAFPNGGGVLVFVALEHPF